jgi:hypothetical protein
MPMPRSVTRINRNGVTFISSVDRVRYTTKMLTTAALYDIAKLLIRRMRLKGSRIGGRKLKGTKRLKSAFQYWLLKIENELLIGTKANTWYGEQQELGTLNQPKREIIRGTVMENIDIIEQIQAHYLEHIQNDREARIAIERAEREAEQDLNDE